MGGCGRFCQAENAPKARSLSSTGQRAGRRNQPGVRVYGWSGATQTPGHGCSTCTGSRGSCPGMVTEKKQGEEQEEPPSSPSTASRPGTCEETGHVSKRCRKLPACYLRQRNSLQSTPFPTMPNAVIQPTARSSPCNVLTQYPEEKSKMKLTETSKTISLHETFKSNFCEDCWLMADTKENLHWFAI